VGERKAIWFFEPVENLVDGWWHGKEERARAASFVLFFVKKTIYKPGSTY